MKYKTLDTWHQTVKTRDLNAIDALLADDVIFFSPVVHLPQKGRGLTKLYLTAALYVFVNETFKYVREVKSENNVVLEFEVLIDGLMVNGVDMIKFNEEGLINEFKVMIRPLKAITLIQQKMQTMLEANSKKP